MEQYKVGNVATFYYRDPKCWPKLIHLIFVRKLPFKYDNLIEQII